MRTPSTLPARDRSAPAPLRAASRRSTRPSASRARAFSGRRRRRRSGHATAEAVIMIPFFIIVWGCIIWASKSFENEIDLASKTREHAWQHAMNNCSGPDGSADGTQVSDYDTGGIFGAVDEVFSLIDQAAGIFAVTREWPGLSFEEHHYEREDVVPAPDVTGADDRETYYHKVLMCNEVHDTPDIEETAWRAFTVFGF